MSWQPKSVPEERSEARARDEAKDEAVAMGRSVVLLESDSQLAIEGE